VFTTMMANKGLQKARACLNWVPRDPEEKNSCCQWGVNLGLQPSVSTTWRPSNPHRLGLGNEDMRLDIVWSWRLTTVQCTQ